MQIKGRTYLRSLGGVKVGKKGRGVQTWGTSAYWNTKWKLLTPEQQDAWGAYAAANLQYPMKGWCGNTTGRQSFQGFNFSNRWNGGTIVQTDPPALPVVLPDPCPRVSKWLVNTVDGYKADLLTAVPAGYRVVVGAFAPQLTNAKPNLKTCLKITELVGPISAGLIGPFAADYVTTWGPMPASVKQWYRFWLLKDNQSCNMGDACAPLSAFPPPPPPPPEGDGWVLITQWQQGPALMVNDAQFNGQDVPDFNTESGEGSGFEWHWPDSIPAQQALFTVLDIDSPTIPSGLLNGWHIHTPDAIIQDYSVTAIRMIVVENEWVQDGAFNVEVAVIQDGFSWQFNF